MDQNADFCLGSAISCNLGGTFTKKNSVRCAPTDGGAPLSYCQVYVPISKNQMLAGMRYVT